MPDPKEAEERLIALLAYVKEVAKLHTKPEAEQLRLVATAKDEGSFVLHEDSLVRLQQLRGADDRPFVTIAELDEPVAGDDDAVWMRVRRPEGDDRKTALGQQVCAVYAQLFTAHQEALREGRGAQMTAGVGIVRWQLDGATAIEHPLVLIPAELALDEAGDFVIRLADAAQASIWAFPGLPQLVPARLQLEACAKSYRLLGAAARSPTEKARWEPLLRRAAHCLSADGVYVETAPKAGPKGGALVGALDRAPHVHNGFAIWTREEAGERGLAADCDALADALRALPSGALPTALSRLAGIFDSPPSPRPPPSPAPPPPPPAAAGGLRGLMHMLVGAGAASDASTGSGRADDDAFLYFGLPANAAQEAVVATLARSGCAVLVGPPGTGKSQTIANVICHYLATGRRVLVTSKGEPATEVLREKLPLGVRELCISLGSGDSTSFRRLEASVEFLADRVAATPLAQLAAETARLRRHVRAISAELRETEAAEERWASPHFPRVAVAAAAAAGASGGGAEGGGGGGGGGGAAASDSFSLPLHAEHLACLGLASPGSTTLTQLADAVTTVLAANEGSQPPPWDAPSPATSGGGPAARHGALAASRAFFLEGVEVDPLKPPPAEALLEEVRHARRRAADALVWGEGLRASAPAAEALGTVELRALALRLRESAELEAAIARGELPQLASVGEAAGLESRLEALGAALRRLEGACAQAPAPLDGGGGGGGWLFALLRHADSEAARRAFECAVRLALRLVELTATVESAEPIRFPAVLLRLAEQSARAAVAAAARAPAGSAGASELPDLLGESELATEVRWHARPEQRSLFARLRRSTTGGPSQTLAAALTEVEVGGRAPATALEWAVVQAGLELHAAEAAVRAAWLDLAVYTSPPPLPTAGLEPHPRGAAAALGRHVRTVLAARLQAARDALGCATGLAQAAARALVDGAPATPAPPHAADRRVDWLAACSVDVVASAAACAAAAAKVRSALHTRSAELEGARAQLGALLRQLARAEPAPPAGAGAHGPSPLAQLAAAFADLSILHSATSAEAAIGKVVGAQARVREARASLAHLAALQTIARALRAPGWAAHLLRPDPPPTAARGAGGACPADARRLWAAAAAMAALRSAEQRDPAASRGVSAAQRLAGELEAAVCALVAAAAKEALRAAMSPATCAGLMRLVSAVGQAGAAQSDSVRAARYREDLALALADCALSVPCWIMPTWRISQCLPPTVGSFDLVVLDEASQSDLTALPALLRGARVLVVGDGKQVSPSTAFVAEARIAELKASLRASRHPFVEQLLPGRSMFDLAQTCYADARVALRQHFRCVPACIAFSNARFYHGRLQPCRLPPRSKRLEPALVDIRVADGARAGKAKTNEAEARALVGYLAAGLASGELGGLSIGIISLAGLEQARLLRALLLDSVSDALLARHRIVCGDAAAFQGDERDVVLLSMVSSPGAGGPQLGRGWEQKYNVALSRARDRLVLFRSLDARHVPNADDMRRWALAFFEGGGGSGGGGGAHLADGGAPLPLVAARAGATGGGAALTPEGALLGWLADRRFRFSAECAVAGSAAVVEDAVDDRRLCVCLDGGGGSTLAEWRACMREQRSLERAGWRFCRLWRASWLVDPAHALDQLARALDAAGVRPVSGLPHASAPPATQPAWQPLPPRAPAAASAAAAAGRKRKEPAATRGDGGGEAAAGASPQRPRKAPAAARADALSGVEPPTGADQGPAKRPVAAAANKKRSKADDSDDDWEPS